MCAARRLQYGKIAAMEWNPILVRETRSRFRHQAAFWLLFGYAVLLASTMGWRYSEAFSGSPKENPLFRMPAIGHELFVIFCCMQAFAWALIAPGITSSAIAREREDGLLEGLQLSPMAPRSILGGKLLSAFSYISLLILISLPVEAVCFLMGGVSPGEFWAALLLHASTAFFGASIGLTCSALSRRANIALRTSYILVIGWLITSSLASGSKYPLYSWTNPIIAALNIGIPQYSTVGAPFLYPFDEAPWLMCVIFQLVLGTILLLVSCNALRRPFEARDEANLHRMQQTAVLLATSGSTPSGTKTRAKVTDWIEVPLAARLRFNNPVLQREARGKFRLRMPSLWLLIFEILLAIPVTYYYLLALWNVWTDTNSRESAWWVISFIALLVIAIASAIMGAGAITREREGATWNSLRMSLVTPHEIVFAKVGAVLISFFVYSIPFWPLLLPAAMFEGMRNVTSTSGLDVVKIVFTIAILASTAICYTLWGMFWSWRTKRTSVAVGWTLGTLFFILVFAPAFTALASILSGEGMQWLFAYHPFVSLALVTAGEETAIGLLCCLFLLIVSSALWRLVAEAIGRESEF